MFGRGCWLGGSWGLGLEDCFVDLAFVLLSYCESEFVDRWVSWALGGCIVGRR